ncbi:hypothetical protein FB45DRAFT_859292 [Roridomyces roridus]|uniref:Uncharacterized protein n=1 Tax=Roridomyces roridus TaxID=1738132 RepID=A0AAD7CM38_9AGAR|nr:hypothetical protein FB45DRAFT_859292 [Roridomyces roridus]
MRDSSDFGEAIVCQGFDLRAALFAENTRRIVYQDLGLPVDSEDVQLEPLASTPSATPAHVAPHASSSLAPPLSRKEKMKAKKRVHDRHKRKAAAREAEDGPQTPTPSPRILKSRVHLYSNIMRPFKWGRAFLHESIFGWRPVSLGANGFKSDLAWRQLAQRKMLFHARRRVKFVGQPLQKFTRGKDAKVGNYTGRVRGEVWDEGYISDFSDLTEGERIFPYAFPLLSTTPSLALHLLVANCQAGHRHCGTSTPTFPPHLRSDNAMNEEQEKTLAKVTAGIDIPLTSKAIDDSPRQAKVLFDNFLANADTRKGFAEETIIRFPLSGQVESAFQSHIESHGCSCEALVHTIQHNHPKSWPSRESLGNTMFVSRETRLSIGDQAARYTSVLVPREAQAKFSNNAVASTGGDVSSGDSDVVAVPLEMVQKISNTLLSAAAELRQLVGPNLGSQPPSFTEQPDWDIDHRGAPGTSATHKPHSAHTPLWDDVDPSKRVRTPGQECKRKDTVWNFLDWGVKWEIFESQCIVSFYYVEDRTDCNLDLENVKNWSALLCHLAMYFFVYTLRMWISCSLSLHENKTEGWNRLVLTRLPLLASATSLTIPYTQLAPTSKKNLTRRAQGTRREDIGIRHGRLNPKSRAGEDLRVVQVARRVHFV